MNTDELFKELEPPRGGAERFAQRLDEIAAERPSHRARILALVAAAAGVALVTAVLLLRQPDDAGQVQIANTPPPVDVYNAPELDRLLGRTAAPAELMVTVNMQAANVTEIETTNQKVRIYQIN
ncbi:MAG TPA: hypothetical protein VGL98_16405 [Gammaproteobacteria bacterium]